MYWGTLWWVTFNCQYCLETRKFFFFFLNNDSYLTQKNNCLCYNILPFILPTLTANETLLFIYFSYCSWKILHYIWPLGYAHLSVVYWENIYIYVYIYSLWWCSIMSCVFYNIKAQARDIMRLKFYKELNKIRNRFYKYFNKM